MDFGSKLKDLRNANKLTQEQLASKLSLSKANISKYEANFVEPNLDTLALIANIFNVTSDYLLGLPGKTIAHIPMDSYHPTHKIPVLGYISAGLPLYADEHIESYTYTDHNGGAEYFALRVKGDSMNAAQINDGNIIIVRKQGVVENGDIAVVRVGSEDATVKRYKQDGNIVQLIPQSFNPAHEIQIYNTKETEINIIGKVVECKIEF